MPRIAKVSGRGQITLPREVRVEPVNDVAGSLAHYAKGRTRIAFRVARKRAWEAVVWEKHKRR